MKPVPNKNTLWFVASSLVSLPPVLEVEGPDVHKLAAHVERRGLRQDLDLKFQESLGTP